jgi:hypothetical protein
MGVWCFHDKVEMSGTVPAQDRRGNSGSFPSDKKVSHHLEVRRRNRVCLISRSMKVNQYNFHKSRDEG